jgi:hypothetical protein
VVVLESREMGWLWQGHVLLVVIWNDAEGNEYCRDGVTAKFSCSSEKRGSFFFCGRGHLRRCDFVAYLRFGTGRSAGWGCIWDAVGVTFKVKGVAPLSKPRS